MCPRTGMKVRSKSGALKVETARLRVEFDAASALRLLRAARSRSTCQAHDAFLQSAVTVHAIIQ